MPAAHVAEELCSSILFVSHADMAGAPVKVLSRRPVHLRGINEAMPSFICCKNVLLGTFDIGKVSTTYWTYVTCDASSDWMMLFMRMHLVSNKFISAISGEAACGSIGGDNATYPVIVAIVDWSTAEFS